MPALRFGMPHRRERATHVIVTVQYRTRRRVVTDGRERLAESGVFWRILAGIARATFARAYYYYHYYYFFFPHHRRQKVGFGGVAGTGCSSCFHAA
jgi:hypothetical protein